MLSDVFYKKPHIVHISNNYTPFRNKCNLPSKVMAAEQQLILVYMNM